MLQFLPIMIAYIFIAIPSWIIVKKAGFNPWWSLLMIIPFVFFFGIWALALKKWPSEQS